MYVYFIALIQQPHGQKQNPSPVNHPLDISTMIEIGGSVGNSHVRASESIGSSYTHM